MIGMEQDLSALRKVTSTGSVLPSDVAVWFYDHGFPETVQLISGSGGTDCSCSCKYLNCIYIYN
jgi:acetoacetyl-CoA synthetase